MWVPTRSARFRLVAGLAKQILGQTMTTATLTEMLQLQADIAAEEKLLAELGAPSVDHKRLLADLRRALEIEEAARASYARRLQSRTEAEDRLARMAKHEPGVSFLGYRSPARRRIHAMQAAAKEHGQAAEVADERKYLASQETAKIRRRLETIEPDTRAIAHRLTQLRQRENTLAQQPSEAKIDEAVMLNLIKPDQASVLRRAVRSSRTPEITR